MKIPTIFLWLFILLIIISGCAAQVATSSNSMSEDLGSQNTSFSSSLAASKNTTSVSVPESQSSSSAFAVAASSSASASAGQSFPTASKPASADLPQTNKGASSADTVNPPVSRPASTIPDFPTLSSAGFDSELEDAIFGILNQKRAEKGLSALTRDPNLDTATRIRSKELYLNGMFAHSRPDGRSWETVLTDYNLMIQEGGENLANAEYPQGMDVDLAAVWYSDWGSSPGHYKNIFETPVTHIGVGVYTDVKDGVCYATVTTIFALY